MDNKKANNVYDLLVSMGGAIESERESFIYHHCESKHGCSEWRFMGKLGYGGKYYSQENRVGCYPEDDTPERRKIISELNEALSKIL